MKNTSINDINTIKKFETMQPCIGTTKGCLTGGSRKIRPLTVIEATSAKGKITMKCAVCRAVSKKQYKYDPVAARERYKYDPVAA